MDDLYWGIIGFVAVLSLMVLGVHVGLALATTGFVGMVVMTGKIQLALALFTTTPYSTTNVYAFAILPLFIIMGLFAMHAGLSARAFDAAYKWVGRLPGGMAIATTWANAMFAACTGSSVVACAVFTRISLPEMDRRNYDKAFACGTIAAAGMLGMLIPPSALMIVYGILTEQSIGKLLIAGVGPGILLTLIFTAGIVLVAIRNPERAPKADYAPPLMERLKATIGVVGIVVLVLGIIAGMYTGIFTPTEAGAAGAAGALVLALIAPFVEKWVFRSETAGAASESSAANPESPIAPPAAAQLEMPGAELGAVQQRYEGGGSDIGAGVFHPHRCDDFRSLPGADRIARRVRGGRQRGEHTHAADHDPLPDHVRLLGDVPGLHIHDVHYPAHRASYHRGSGHRPGLFRHAGNHVH